MLFWDLHCSGSDGDDGRVKRCTYSAHSEQTQPGLRINNYDALELERNEFLCFFFFLLFACKMCRMPSKRKTADVTLSPSHEIFRISVPVCQRREMQYLLKWRFVADSCSMVRFTYFSVQWKIKYILNPSIWSDERHCLYKIFLFRLLCAFYVCLEHRNATVIQYASRRRRFYFLADTKKPKCKRWNLFSLTNRNYRKCSMWFYAFRATL